jgi:hypothetical protein
MRKHININCAWAIKLRNSNCNKVTVYAIKCVNGKIAQWDEEECVEVPEEEADTRTTILYTMKIVSFAVRAVYCSKPVVSRRSHYRHVLETPMMMTMMIIIIIIIIKVKQFHYSRRQALRVLGG